MKTLTILISLLTFSPAFGSVHSQGHAVSVFYSLPPEMIVEIASWLDVHALQNLNSTCKYLRAVTQHELEKKCLLVQQQVWLSATGGDLLATTPYDINGLTAANRNKVWQFNNLWFLDFSYTKISDDWLNCLMYLPMLKSLSLGHTNISSKGMPNLKQSRSLVKFDLQSTMIDDDALQHLTPLKNLQDLNFDDFLS